MFSSSLIRQHAINCLLLDFGGFLNRDIEYCAQVLPIAGSMTRDSNPKL